MKSDKEMKSEGKSPRLWSPEADTQSIGPLEQERYNPKSEAFQSAANQSWRRCVQEVGQNKRRSWKKSSSANVHDCCGLAKRGEKKQFLTEIWKKKQMWLVGVIPHKGKQSISRYP